MRPVRIEAGLVPWIDVVYCFSLRLTIGAEESDAILLAAALVLEAIIRGEIFLLEPAHRPLPAVRGGPA